MTSPTGTLKSWHSFQRRSVEAVGWAKDVDISMSMWCGKKKRNGFISAQFHRSVLEIYMDIFVGKFQIPHTSSQTATRFHVETICKMIRRKLCGKDLQSEGFHLFLQKKTFFYTNKKKIYDTLPYITPSLPCSESPNLAAQLLLL